MGNYRSADSPSSVDAQGVVARTILAGDMNQAGWDLCDLRGPLSLVIS
jgi:hypothetical protein